MRKKSKAALKRLGIFIIALSFITVIFLSVNEVGYRANTKRVLENQPVETRNLELYKDELGYWTFVNQEDSKFSILQLTDIHIGNGFLSFNKDIKALNAVKELIIYSKPDLIIVTGDMVYPVPIQSGTGNNLKASILFAEFISSFGIPWTVTFGNHDYEWYSWYNLDSIAEVYESYDNCLFQRGPEDVYGLSNHFINILNSDRTLNKTLALLDSNSYDGFKFTHYDRIHDDQVEWYENELHKISNHYGIDGLIPSLAFFHIPVNEFEDAWELYRQGSEEVIYHYGKAGEEGERIYAPRQRGNIFKKMVDLGSTEGIFCGHDHYNDFSITYQGIRLTYGKSIDYLAYYGVVPGFSKSTWQRGGTLIEIDVDGSFEVTPITLIDIIS